MSSHGTTQSVDPILFIGEGYFLQIHGGLQQNSGLCSDRFDRGPSDGIPISGRNLV
jgi:hypothetical protein